MSELNLLNKDLTPAEILDIWKKKYADPHDQQTAEAFKIMNDPNHKWRDKEQKEYGRLKWQKMDTQNIDNAILYNAMHDLIKKHDDTLALLAGLYHKWLSNVAYEGVQQKEMMQGQADILNDIFSQIALIIEK